MTLVKIKLDVKDAAYISANPTKVLALNEPIYRNDGLVAYGDGVTPLSGLTFLPLFSGGGQVDTVQGTANRISVDATDPANPIVDISSAYDTAITNAISAAVSILPITLFKRTTPITHTGTTSPTKVASIFFPAGTVGANDVWEISARVVASLNSNNKHFRFRVNTTDTLVGAVLLANMTMTSTMSGFKRIFWFNNTLSAVGALNTGANYDFDETATIVNSSLVTASFNFASAFYLLIECELVSAGDNIVIHNYFSTIRRGSLL